jgi:mono/diheme cytochrome c family protein
LNRLLALVLFTPLVASAGVPRKRSADHVRGQELWERSCWQCHGEEARGDGPAAAGLTAKVPDLRGRVSADRQQELVSLILAGKGMMPAFSEELDRHDARKILVYLRRLENEEPPEVPEAPEAPAEEEENRSAGGAD